MDHVDIEEMARDRRLNEGVIRGAGLARDHLRDLQREVTGTIDMLDRAEARADRPGSAEDAKAAVTRMIRTLSSIQGDLERAAREMR